MTLHGQQAARASAADFTPPPLAFAAASDPGRLRRNNEDALGWDADLGLFVVADGMGGCNAGEVASSLAVRMVLAEYRSQGFPSPAAGAPAFLSPPAMRLCNAIVKANRVVFDSSLAEPRYSGMGTTLVAALFLGGRAIVASVGDSRAYRLRAHEFSQLTVDHTVLQEQLDSGLISPLEARVATNRGLITRALGVEPGLELDIQEQMLEPGDLFLLCTDGLFDMLADADIAACLLSHHGDLDTAAQALVAAANDAGGYDNVSVLAIRIG